MSTITKRHKVLVIDDDPLFRSLLVSLLRTDYLMSVASDGAEGFYKATEYPPDIAIVDIQMPEWDGIRTLKAFREHHALKNTMIIMLTSDASRETVLSAIKAGANDYVIKTSFSKEELKQKIHRLVTRRERERLGLFRDSSPLPPPKQPIAKPAPATQDASPVAAPVSPSPEQNVAATTVTEPPAADQAAAAPVASIPVQAIPTPVIDFSADEEIADELQEMMDDWE